MRNSRPSSVDYRTRPEPVIGDTPRKGSASTPGGRRRLAGWAPGSSRKFAPPQPADDLARSPRRTSEAVDDVALKEPRAANPGWWSAMREHASSLIAPSAAHYDLRRADAKLACVGDGPGLAFAGLRFFSQEPVRQCIADGRKITWAHRPELAAMPSDEFAERLPRPGVADTRTIEIGSIRGIHRPRTPSSSDSLGSIAPLIFPSTPEMCQFVSVNVAQAMSPITLIRWPAWWWKASNSPVPVAFASSVNVSDGSRFAHPVLREKSGVADHSD